MQYTGPGGKGGERKKTMERDQRKLEAAREGRRDSGSDPEYRVSSVNEH
jgi:hypothetical protein